METGSDRTTTPPLAQLIFGGGTPKRAFFTALVVGTILVAINHGYFILGGGMPPLAKIILTYMVPYCVTTWGAATEKRAQLGRNQERST